MVVHTTFCHKRPDNRIQVSSLYFQGVTTKFLERVRSTRAGTTLDKQLSVTSLIYPGHTGELCRLFSCCQSLILASCQSQRMKNDRKRGIVR